MLSSPNNFSLLSLIADDWSDQNISIECNEGEKNEMDRF